MTKACVLCKKQPSYGIRGSKRAEYCAPHKLRGMVNVTRKFCLECEALPSFGIRGTKKATHCVAHKSPEMVNVKDKTCLDCEARPSFGIRGTKKATHCVTHRSSEMVNVKGKRCVSEWCDTQVGNNKYKGYCLQCFVYLFPDNQIVRNYKTKERIVVDFVKTSFSEISWTWDKRVVDGCSGARPDVICDLGDQLIIIEIDENHHGSYNSSCENKRLMKLSQDVAHRPLVVIRFNPDAYRTRDGVRHKSCFGLDGNGRVVVTKHVDWQNRLSCLKKTVQHWTTARTSKVLEVVPLFFTE